ncbi:MAG: hypothetical protein ABSG10_07410 [Terracidiphilus sp.]|jgi:hypothetical protein
MAFNLTSPNRISQRCDLNDLDGWYANELSKIETDSVRKVLLMVGQNLTDFVRWPRSAILLWKGCNRVPPTGKTHRYHQYTESIRTLARAKATSLDGRPNGPAIAAYCLSGGERPERFGSSNKWSIHHVYSGKFLYPGATKTLHAAKEGLHFSQSAGLIAVHPIADGLADEFPFFAWLLRAESFNRFGYDPDGVFSKGQDEFGFHGNPKTEVVEIDSPV